MDYKIYKITNTINKKIYIGLSMDIDRRWKEHIRKSKSNGKKNHLHLSLYKFGKENFKMEIMFDGLTKENAMKKEIELILEYKSDDRTIGYNITKGGEGSFGLKGELNGMFGKKQPSLSILNKSRTGVKLSESHRKNIAISGTGKTHSNESIEKMSLLKKKQWESGVYNSEEYRSKIGNKKGTGGKERIKIMCNETGDVYNSISECVRKMDLPKRGGSNISYQIKGIYKKIYGYTFTLA